nr:hypothetical protein [Tanacetum cinerariifolium]
MHAPVEWKLYDLSEVKCYHWQYKFPLLVKVIATARRLEMLLPEVCTAIEEKKKKLDIESKAFFDSEISQLSLNQKKQHIFNILNVKPLEIAFLKFIERVIISTHSYPIQVLVVMPFDDLKFGDSDDSTFGVDILSRLPVDCKSIELLTFEPPMRDSSESIFIIADCLIDRLSPCKLLQEIIRAPSDSCMILSSAHSLLGQIAYARLSASVSSWQSHVPSMIRS